MHLYQTIHHPLITEKVSKLQDENKYAFAVSLAANKIQIKAAVEAAFKVKVSSVNMIRVKGERKRGRSGVVYTTPASKKAIVTLKEGYKLQLVEGV